MLMFFSTPISMARFLCVRAREGSRDNDASKAQSRHRRCLASSSPRHPSSSWSPPRAWIQVTSPPRPSPLTPPSRRGSTPRPRMCCGTSRRPGCPSPWCGGADRPREGVWLRRPGRPHSGDRYHDLPARLHHEGVHRSRDPPPRRGRSTTLDDPVVEHLPDHPGLDLRITLRHLLSHTRASRMPASSRRSRKPVASGPTAASRSTWSPRSRSTSNRVRSTRIATWGSSFSSGIEHVTGTPYGDYVRGEILRSMGLDRTFQCPDEQRPDAQWAHGYDVQYGTWTRALRLGRPPAFIDPPPINMAVVSSAGALCSTAIDLARWPGKLRTFLDPASSERCPGRPSSQTERTSRTASGCASGRSAPTRRCPTVAW